MMASGDIDSPVMQTLVFMDLETTSLHKPRICELCMIAVDKDLLLSCNISSLPRVQDKLLLCINPRRPISFQASQITGLYNDELEKSSPWDKETVELIARFISRLPKPVCFIAHNGFLFDFPVLRAEMDRMGMTFEPPVYCADSLHIIRAIDAMDQCRLMQARSPAFCESPVVGSSSPKLPGAPKKCRGNKIVNFEPFDNAIRTGDSNEATGTPVSRRDKSDGVAAVRSVKRNLLGDFNGKSLKKVCRVSGVVSGVASADAETRQICDSERKTRNSILIDDVCDCGVKTGDTITMKTCDRKCESNGISRDVPHDTRLAVTNCDVSSGDAGIIANDVEITPSDEEFMSIVEEMERTNEEQRKPLTTIDVDFGVPSDCKKICAFGEITPEKRLGEVCSPPKTPIKTPTKQEKRNAGSSKFSLSLMEKFNEVGNCSSDEIPGIERTCEVAKSRGVSEGFSTLSICKLVDDDHDHENLSANCASPINGPISEVESPVSEPSPVISQSRATPKTTSYRLEDVFRRYFGASPANSHSAEDDCSSMLKIASARAGDFCALVNRQRVPFVSLSFRP